MEELQEFLTYKLDDLPEEVILKVLGFLDTKELLLCGQVSQRLRAISNDGSLWRKLNLCRGQDVPYGFIEKAARNGCQYMSLDASNILNLSEKSESPFNLKYLIMSQKFSVLMPILPNCQESPTMVQNCNSLQKLSLANLSLDSDDIQYIRQNGQTLQVLDIAGCRILKPWMDFCTLTNSLQDLFMNCAHLTEFHIHGTILLGPHIQTLVDNLTPTILKVAITCQKNLQFEHVNKLVTRCNKITHLDLSLNNEVTNDYVGSIIKHLNTTLEKLDLSNTMVDFAGLLELKCIPTLKSLVCKICVSGTFGYFDSESIKNLKQQFPNICITDKNIRIASPFKREHERESPEFTDRNSIWEIKAKEQNLFARSWRSLYQDGTSIFDLPI